MRSIDLDTHIGNAGAVEEKDPGGDLSLVVVGYKKKKEKKRKSDAKKKRKRDGAGGIRGPW